VRATVDFQTEWDWSNRGWRLDEAGGYLLDMHVHDVDLLLWLAGRIPKRVWAIGENRADREGTVVLEFDAAYARLDWSGRISGRQYPKGASTAYQLACQRGRVEIEVGDQVIVESIIDGRSLGRQSSPIGEQLRASWDGMWSAQAAALLGKGALPVRPEEGVDNVRASMAAVEALNSHTVQRL
jgi:predicted dehydrogenase